MDKNSSDKDKIVIIKKRQKDRRRKPTPPFSKYTYLGLRKKNRRTEDRKKNYYVDRYGRKTLVFAFLVVVLCLIDTSVTL